jgi:hypothetical protein
MISAGDINGPSTNPIYVPLGGTADVYFYITGSSSENLASFQLQLQITPVAAGQLQFAHVDPSASPPIYLQSDSFISNSNYVFSGNSTATSPFTFWNSTSTTIYPDDTITGGDTGASGFTQTFPNPNTTDGRYLLAGVQVVAGPGTAPGESFVISLVQDSTYFDDTDGNPLDYSYAFAPVDIENATVPEPSSLVLATGMGGLVSLVSCWRSRRKARFQG